MVIKIRDFFTYQVLIRSFVLGFARLGEDDIWWESDGKTIIIDEDEAKNSSLDVDCREGSRYVMLERAQYRKIPKISPSKYKPPKPVTRKNPPLNGPSKHKPPGDLNSEIVLKYEAKQSKNGKFTSNYKASPTDFETQDSLRR